MILSTTYLVILASTKFQFIGCFPRSKPRSAVCIFEKNLHGFTKRLLILQKCCPNLIPIPISAKLRPSVNFIIIIPWHQIMTVALVP